jgi:hypothetical protein
MSWAVGEPGATFSLEVGMVMSWRGMTGVDKSAFLKLISSRPPAQFTLEVWIQGLEGSTKKICKPSSSGC